MEGGLIFETIDKFLESKTVEKILEFTDEGNAAKIGLYLQQSATFSSPDESVPTLETCFSVYMKAKLFPLALRIAMHMTSSDKVNAVFDAAKNDRLLVKQLSLMLIRQRVPLPDLVTEDEELLQLANGEILTKRFAFLAKELDVVEAKTPDEVYKAHLEERRGGTQLDSAKQNLASTYVNAFVNAGFCSDKLMLNAEEDWIHKNKDHGKTAAAASLGMILMWNNESAITEIDKYQWAENSHTKAGAMLGFGIATAGVRDNLDAALAINLEALEAPEAAVRIGALMGLGIGYCATSREDIIAQVVPLAVDSSLELELCAHACLCLGMVFAGTGNEEVTEAITQALMERAAIDPKQLDDPVSRYMGVALGLLFLRRRNACDTLTELINTIEHPMSKYVTTTIKTCAYACSSDVLGIQELLHQLSGAALETHAEEEKEIEVAKEEAEKAKKAAAASTTDDATTAQPQPTTTTTEKKTEDKAEDKKKSTTSSTLDIEDKLLHQGAATIGIPLIALGEPIAVEMTSRLIDRLLQYGELPIKRAVPFAMALNFLSNPRPPVVDALSRMSHDADADVALHAILALGLVAAGTNNARVAGLLRQLAGYYSRDANALYTIRLAQGLVYLGKGLLSLSLTHSDGYLINNAALACITLILHAGLSFKDTIMNKHHYILYALANAIHPKWLITVDEDLNPLPVQVRVGQAIDVVGQAGIPRSITGFQTHNSPVLMNPGERAELGDDEYIPLTSVMEGIVILKKNPNFQFEAGK